MLRQRRWREPHHHHLPHWLILALVVLLHGLFVLVTWYEMRPPAAINLVHLRLDDVMRVRFIAREPSTAAVKPPPPAKPRVLPRRPEPVAKDAMTMQSPMPKIVDTAPLYDEHGQPQLPAAAASAPAPSAGYVQNTPFGDTQIMQHTSQVNYQATRFDQHWGKSNAVDSALQKVVDKSTIKQTIRLPKGIRLHCAISIIPPGGGCGGDPPAPPSAKDGDERLSMAPATSLAPDPHVQPPPSEAACIAMYRAGKPLAWGCPVDTPNRAIDAELRDRAAGATGQH